MKKFLIALMIELVVIAIASIVTYAVWNDMASNYFHYKDIEFMQAVMMTGILRVLTIKLD